MGWVYVIDIVCFFKCAPGFTDVNSLKPKCICKLGFNIYHGSRGNLKSIGYILATKQMVAEVIGVDVKTLYKYLPAA